MKTLIVAFDGLDYELIQEFNLEHIPQKEFGKIDNDTNITARMTSELFSSFITGETHEVHGVEGISYYENKPGKSILNFLEKHKFRQKYRGFNRLQNTLESLFDIKKIRYGKKDLEVDTWFEQIEGSRAMYIPGYNPDMFWESRCEAQPLKYGYGREKMKEFLEERVFEVRKKNLFGELESDIIGSRELLMCHFHLIDFYQDYHKGEHVEGTYRQKLNKMYNQMDNLAKEIKEKAEKQGYEQIIFMSDHGLPGKRQHNKNAFYSSNTPIFPDSQPHITDFHEKIID